MESCSACPEFEYQAKEGHSETSCLPQTECPKGKRLSSLAKNRKGTCKWALTCEEGEHISNHKASKTPVCSPCPVGTYQPENGHQIDECKSQTECTFGYRISAASTVKEQECVPCAGDQYLGEAAHRTEVCQTQPTCGIDQHYRNASNGDGRHAEASCEPCPLEPSKLVQPLVEHREGSCVEAQASSSDGATGGTAGIVVTLVVVLVLVLIAVGVVYGRVKKRNQRSASPSYVWSADANTEQLDDTANACGKYPTRWYNTPLY